MSRFATVKSEEARFEAMAESADMGDLDENDPQSVARFMKKMGSEFGDELGDDFDSAVDEAMAESDEPDELPSGAGDDGGGSEDLTAP